MRRNKVGLFQFLVFTFVCDYLNEGESKRIPDLYDKLG